MKRNGRMEIAVALVLAVWTATACGNKGNEQTGQAPDSVARNLTLVPNQTSPALSDTAAAEAPAPEAAPAPSPTPTRPRAQPAPRRTAPTPRKAPPAPPAPASYTAAVGTHVPLVVGDTISSRSAKVGQTFTAHVASDVTDGAGHVVIPEGSTVTGTITSVKAGGASSAGTLGLAIDSVTVRGTTYPLVATIDSVSTIRQGRGVTGAEAAKVGVGAVAGAIAGRIIGRNTRGAVIGGVVGAAAGAGVAAATRNVDIVLPAGAHVEIELTQPITMPAR